MIPQPPPGQGPIDPQGAFPSGPPAPASPPPPPASPPGQPQPAPAGAGADPGQAPPPPPTVCPTPSPNVMHNRVPNMTPNPTHNPHNPMPPMQMMPQMMPPMMPYPYPPPPRRGGAGRAVLVGLLVLLLLFSGVLNLMLIAGSLGDGGAGITQHTVQGGGGKDKVVIVPLRGIIDTALAAQFDRFLDTAEADQSVKALVIEIDSPGGTVTASDEVYHRIQGFKGKKSIPVVVSMGSLATSGGYYAACGADFVFAQPTTFTGNIGVLMPRYNFSKLMEKYGVEETTIVSTGAPFKNAGSSFQAETPEEKQYMQDLADSAFAQFKDVVSQGRGSKLKGNMEEVANGKVYTADIAEKLGLIDKVGYLDDAQAYATSEAKLNNPTIVRYQDPPSLMQLLMARSNVAGALAAGGGNAPMVNITFDQNLLHELSTPRPLYLWRGQ